MCTAIISVDPASPVPVLLIGVRDEFVDRDWEPPAAHWPDRPGLIGGRDLRAGGTWLAVDPGTPRAGVVLNGRGAMAPEAGRVSRGGLPLLAAAGGRPARPYLPSLDPFHLVRAEPGAVRLWSWDGTDLAERDLGPGLHMIVNSGLDGEGRQEGETEDAYMAARLAHFRPRLAAAPRPAPGLSAPGLSAPGLSVPGRDEPVEQAWGDWLALVDGDGLPRADHRALLPLLDVGDGRVWGTTSVTLVALAPAGVRYDFSAAPGDPRAWTRVR